MDRFSSVFIGLVCLTCLAAAGACAPAHVQLAAPPDADAAVGIRVAFYEAHRPIIVSTATQSLLLADGLRVSHVHDLTAHLDENAPTVVAAARADAARADADGWLGAGVTTAAVGIALELVGGAVAIVLVASDPQSQSPPPQALAALAVSVGGAAVGIVGIVIAGVVGTAPAIRAAIESETALLSYDGSLRRRLALTDDDLLASRGFRPAVKASPAAATALDDAPPTARLQIGVLPPACPDAAVLRAGVVARIGRDPFVDVHDDVINVEAVDGADGLTVTVSLLTGDEVVGVRSQEGALDACDELLSRAALSIAVLLDPLSPLLPLSPLPPLPPVLPIASEPTP